MRKNIFIVEDHEYLRMALEMTLSDDPRFHVCGVAKDIPEAIASIGGTAADLVILDLSFPGGSGLDLIRELRSMEPPIRCMVFSQQDPEVFAKAARAVGASGYLRKGAAPDMIVEAVAQVAGGGEFFPDIAGHPISG